MLKKLTDADVKLVGVAKLLADEIDQVTSDQWNENSVIEKLKDILGQFRSLVEERRLLLLVDTN